MGARPSFAAAPPSSAVDRYAPLLTALRWVCLTSGLVASVPFLPRHRGVLLATVILFGAALWRTVRPPRADHGPAVLVGDLALTVAAVVASGSSQSPYLFALLPQVFLVGVGQGYAWGLLGALGASTTLGVLELASDPASLVGGTSWRLSLTLLLAAGIGGYARRLALESEARGQAAEVELERLREANGLLAELHRIALALPSSLDLRETLDTAVQALRERFSADAVAVLLVDAASDSYRPGAALGLRLPPRLEREGLPAELHRAAATGAIVRLRGEQGARGGISRRAASALYAPLLARERVVGLLAIETAEAGRYGENDAQLLGGFAEPLALALDNAVWFARLQALGADAERDRLARELHDHLGQGLAYLALELDRLTGRRPDDVDLARVRDEARSLVREVKETLRDLRADVSPTCDLAALAEAYLARLQQRTGLTVDYRCETEGARLPVLVERELWRILQEAAANVVRHAGASTLEVRWRIGPDGASLVVGDDGRGFDRSRIPDGKGIARMHERANAVGARLAVTTKPGQGTAVRVDLSEAL